MENSKNEYGLFDAPVRSSTIEDRVLTQEELQEQFDSGAFVMTRAEAIAAGFINPHDEQDTRVLDVRR